MGGVFSGGGTNIVNREQRMSGIRLQSSSYGNPIGIYYGPNRATGNLIWYGDFEAIEVRSESSQGGKGGGDVKTTNISYNYRASFVFSMGEGLLTVTEIMPDNEGFKHPSEWNIEIFDGAIGQPEWGVLTAKHPNQSISYSGLAGFRAASYDLGNNASMPNFSVKLVGHPHINTRLSGYIQHFITDPVVGVGFPSVRLFGLNEVEDYLISQDMYFSPYAVDVQEASSYLRNWCNMANVETVWSEGYLKFKPRYDVAGLVAELTPDDFITESGQPPVRMKRSDPADAFNSLRVNYYDVENDYNESAVVFKDQANIDQYGLRPAPNESYNGIKAASRAQWVAEHRGKRKLYVRNEYYFTLSWRWARLEPMDVITLTDPKLGLYNDAVQIIEITENADGLLDFVAEEYNGTVNGVEDVPPIQVSFGGGIDQGVAPGNVNEPAIFQPPIALTPSGPEIWLAVSGGVDWGGCEIWASLDNISYRRLSIVVGAARHGTLRQTLQAGISPDTTNTLRVRTFAGELLTGTTQDAVDLLTLMWVDGEFLAYRDSNFVAAGDYDLSYLVRGAYGTARTAHANGSKWARIDEKIYKYPVPKDWYGRTIYLKFTSFNKFGLSTQALSDVVAYPHVISNSIPPTLVNLAATVFQTTVTLTWSRPAGYEDFSRVDILRAIGINNFNNALLVANVGAELARYSDPVGVSSVQVHYWIRLVGKHGDVGPVSAPVSVTTGKIGKIAVVNNASTLTSVASEDEFQVHSLHTASMWVWNVTAEQYEDTRNLANGYYNLVAATQAKFSQLSAITADMGAITAGQMQIGGYKFAVDAAGNVVINSGGFTAYNFPPPGQVGYHISSAGALWGNASDGRYVHIQNDGYFAFIRNGNGIAATANGVALYGQVVIRENITDAAINTQKILNNAVTNTAYLLPAADFLYSSNNPTVGLLNFTSTGQVVVVIGSFDYTFSGAFQSGAYARAVLYIDGVEVRRSGSPANLSYATVLPAGQHSYEMRLESGNGAIGTISNRFLLLMELKK
jgi:hypothetical protein